MLPKMFEAYLEDTIRIYGFKTDKSRPSEHDTFEQIVKKAKESFDLKHSTQSASKSKVKNMPFDNDQARALEWMVKRALDDVTQPIRDGLETLRVKLEETEKMASVKDLEKELKDICYNWLSTNRINQGMRIYNQCIQMNINRTCANEQWSPMPCLHRVWTHSKILPSTMPALRWFWTPSRLLQIPSNSNSRNKPIPVAKASQNNKRKVINMNASTKLECQGHSCKLVDEAHHETNQQGFGCGNATTELCICFACPVHCKSRVEKSSVPIDDEPNGKETENESTPATPGRNLQLSSEGKAALLNGEALFTDLGDIGGCQACDEHCVMVDSTIM
uniref:Uncharacterized protein n=1 Tax=Romanomermis culicivorax TaxID=13658 RepID=A0A915HNM4_ROMCU